MTREAPSPDCVEVGFSRGYELAEGAEVALEDYARVLSRARAAEAVAEPGGTPRRLRGVHLCAPEVAPDEAASGDMEAFARELAAPGNDRLGWS